MITIFHGTARTDSNSRKIANFYDELLGDKNIPHQFFTLEGVDETIFNKTFHDKKHPQLESIEEHILAPTSKYIFIIPEYNGSFPGMFKGFIDACDVKKCFHNKKASLTGVADGRAGNIRGMEHLTNIFNHLRMDVLYYKIPISQVSNHLDKNGKITDNEIVKMIDTQIDLLMKF
jgi:NAD(P)H-dependent FMN reductase